jgi:IAA-amino acid hydrolase
MARGIAAVNRCEATVSYPIQDHPPTTNAETAWRVASRAAATVVGAGGVAPMEPILGAEDFSFYQQRIPGCFTFIGVSHATWGTRYGVHHERFKVDEAALPIGAAMHVATALEALAGD